MKIRGRTNTHTDSSKDVSNRNVDSKDVSDRNVNSKDVSDRNVNSKDVSDRNVNSKDNVSSKCTTTPTTSSTNHTTPTTPNPPTTTTPTTSNPPTPTTTPNTNTTISSTNTTINTLILRSILTLTMIPSFILLCKCSTTTLIIFIIVLCLCVYKEIVGITRMNNEYSIHKYLVMSFSLLIFVYHLSSIFIYIRMCIQPIFFYCYTILLMLFVSSLRNGLLKKQFATFSVVHLCGYILGLSCKCAIRNIYTGKFWLFFPSTLVICNDIFAYIIGKLIGRTPLYKLSPKKTVEGFIGGFVFTCIYGVCICYKHIHTPIFDEVYINELRQVYTICICSIQIQITCIYIHCIPHIVMASFIAPFSGFMGSALKRAYRIKDFGTAIPGHGGLADRFDCQLLMVVFTTVYINTFMKTRTQMIRTTYLYITNKFTKEEIITLVQKLLVV